MINDAKPYPRMKDSGQPWLGDVPEHWEVDRLKWRLARNDTGAWGESANDGTVVLRSTEQRVDGSWNIKNPARVRLSDDERAKTLLAIGDLLVTKSSGSATHIGKTSLVNQAVADLDCCFSNFMQRIRPHTPKLSSELLLHLLNSSIGRAQFVYFTTTTTGLGNLNGTILGDCTFAFPPPAEQAGMVRVLAAVDRRVNRLVRAKRRLLGLLAEQKQAVITHAVTRGLNPHAPTKPSGIPWLGDVPKHWEVTKLGRVAQSFRTGPFGSTLHQADYVVGGVPVINPVHMRESRLQPNINVSVTQETAERLSVFSLSEGDVVFSRRGELGRFAIVRSDDPACLCGTGSLRVRLPYDRMTQAFLAITLQLPGVVDHLRSSSIGATMESLKTADLKGIPLLLPPVEEQDKIVALVDRQCLTLNAAADLARREIDLIREYRTRLVADVVTGKLDVRAAAERLGDEDTDEHSDEIEHDLANDQDDEAGDEAQLVGVDDDDSGEDA